MSINNSKQSGKIRRETVRSRSENNLDGYNRWNNFIFILYTILFYWKLCSALSIPDLKIQRGENGVPKWQYMDCQECD